MPWEFKSDRQIWLQLAEILTQQIVSGQYPPGVRMPSVRDLASVAGVNPNTMQRALVYLEDSGLVSAQRNSGRYVTEDVDLIGFTRRKLALSEMEKLYHKLYQLGFSEEEISELMKQKEEKK